MKTQNTAIEQESINKMQEKEQALNGWIALDAAGIDSSDGNFSGVLVLAGTSATITPTFSDNRCVLNSVSIDLVEGTYLPTPGMTSVTVTAGKILVIKGQIF